LTVPLCGIKLLGSSQSSGLWCRFHVEINMSVPRNNLTPPLRPDPPGGRLSVILAQWIKTGGSGSGYSCNASMRL
jgi:hypothetical protein